MLIPLRTDRPPRRRPLVTESLILVNLLVYLAGLVGQFTGVFEVERLIDLGHFHPLDRHWWQLVTYQFLHDPYGIGHIAFNMLFLWVFGSPVEDRLGRVGFLGFYLIGGAVAALLHAAAEPNPVIGASGSIAAVTGAFLALFPRSRIKILFFFFLIGIFEIPSLWFIGFYFVIDFLRQTQQMVFGGPGQGVAYMAHLAGYLYGFGTGFALLATGILKHEEFDVFFLFKQSRRRAAFRSASRGQTGGLWSSASADTGERLARKSRRARAASDRDDERKAALRAEVHRALSGQDPAAGAAAYRRLLEVDGGAVLAERQQVEIGNQLYREGDYASAARAYELLLERYRTVPEADEITLILGLIYTRHLERADRARELVTRARGRLRDDGQIALADNLLEEIELKAES